MPWGVNHGHGQSQLRAQAALCVRRARHDAPVGVEGVAVSAVACALATPAYSSLRHMPSTTTHRSALAPQTRAQLVSIAVVSTSAPEESSDETGVKVFSSTVAVPRGKW